MRVKPDVDQKTRRRNLRLRDVPYCITSTHAGRQAKETLVRIHGKFDPSKFKLPSDFNPVSFKTTMGSERWSDGKDLPWHGKPPHQQPMKTHGSH